MIRSVFSRAAVLILLVLGAPLAAAVPQASTVRDAFLFAFPVYEMMRVRAQPGPRGPRAPNTIYHRTTLSTATNREVTAPNNDTLYSSAWLDLARGPVTLTMPSLPGRYHSVHLLDLFTDQVAVLGTRLDQGRGGQVLIAGPKWQGRAPPGVRLVRAPMNDLWMIVRVLVDGPADLAKAQAAQAAFVIDATASAVRPFAAATPTMPGAAQFLDVVNAAFARGPLPPIHAARVARFARVGIVPGRANAWQALSPALRAEWEAQLPTLYAELRSSLSLSGTRRNGWVYPAAGLGEFGTDDLYRSRVALGGLAALPASEAMYVGTTQDGSGAALDGTQRYTIRIPADVPVDGFWSLTMYTIEPDGRFFFHPNALDRYSLGNRTRGLVRDADGSILIRMQAAPPEATTGNWLPTPPGRFRLSFRAYLPGARLRDGSFLVPAVERER